MIRDKFIFTPSHQMIFLIILSLGLNINTIFNEYAVDDVVVFTENTIVTKGVSGIPEIISTDLFAGFEKTGKEGLSETRYRPFTLVIFAIEYQFFGTNPMISHLINILLFALLTGLLYRLLNNYLFRKDNKLLAFISCLLFVVHPIHAEVIANVKSRDEIITFVLLIASLTLLLKNFEKSSAGIFITGLLCFFLALLTRESAITFAGVYPLILYFFFNQTIKKSITRSLPLFAVIAIYLTTRFMITGFGHSANKDVLNSPFLLATSMEAFATKVYILLKYLWLLFYPYPLSSDYGYNQIPYISIFSFQFFFALTFLIALIVFSVLLFKKRSIFSFSILYFLVTISLASNFVIDIGTPLSERLLFQPSLAFCIAIASGYQYLKNKSGIISGALLLVILVLFSFKTFSRNSEWKSNETLYLADVAASPNSFRTNLYAAQQYLLKAKPESNKALKNEYINKAILYGERAIIIYPDYPIAYLNLGIAYFARLDYFKTAELWLKAYHLEPANSEFKESVKVLSNIFLNEGNKFHKNGNTTNAIICYLKSVELNERNIEAWYNLGGNYFLIDDTKKAIEAWQYVQKLDPAHPLNKEEFEN